MTYQEKLTDWKKQRRRTLVDALSTGLTFVDEICVDSGLLEETGLMTELTSSVCGALPFVIIAVTEGSRVILGRKPAETGAKDTAWRMAKTGAALGVGAAVTAAVGFWPALPVTIGVRALMDSCRSRALTGLRVRERTDRLRALNGMLRQEAEEPVRGDCNPAENML